MLPGFVADDISLRKIRRMIFTSLTKWDGRQDVPLPLTTIKQIAGRAGRYGMLASKDKIPKPAENEGLTSATFEPVPQPPGEVTCMAPEDLRTLEEALAHPFVDLKAAALSVAQPDLEILSRNLAPKPLTELLSIYDLFSQHGSAYTFSESQTHAMEIVDSVVGHDVDTGVRMTLSMAPVPRRDPMSIGLYRLCCTAFANGTDFDIRQLMTCAPILPAIKMLQGLRKLRQAHEASGTLPPGSIQALSTPRALESLESLHKALTVYLWLAQRQPVYFGSHTEAGALKRELEKCIDWVLVHMRGRSIPSRRL